MPLVEDKGTYVRLTAIEPYSVQTYKRALEQVRESCQQYRRDKALADIRNIDQPIPFMEKFELGIEIARVLGSGIKLAILAPSQIIDRLGENVAVNRGGRAYVTDSEQAALNWLEQD